MPSANRQEQINRWFNRRILGDPKAHALLMEAVHGDNRWINSVHRQHIPHYFKDAARWRLFKHALRKLAQPIWAARNAAYSATQAEETLVDDAPCMVLPSVDSDGDQTETADLSEEEHD